MNIKPEEKDNAIESILSNGLVKPMSTPAFLWDMWRNLGFRVIFWETGAAFLISCAIAVTYVAVISFAITPLEATQNLYAMLFLFSPAIFVSLTLCTEAIERSNGLLEIKMTSKYTIRQVTAFRLLCFSSIGIVSTIIGSAIITNRWEALNFLRIFSLGLCSLFICSLLIIYTMRRLRGGWYIGAIIWTALGMLPMLLFSEVWEGILSNLPIAVVLGIAVAACLLFIHEIKITTKGVLCYADC
jgi:hypothetical protein